MPEGSDPITPSSIGALSAQDFTWDNLGGRPESFTPSTHKSSHSTGGADALSPPTLAAATAEDVAGKSG